MKTPFDLGTRFVLRLVIPSCILATVLFPVASHLKAMVYPSLGNEFVFISVGLTGGFGLLLMDMPIYMLLEGRRFWPTYLRAWGVRRETKRLSVLLDASNNANEKLVQVEADLLSMQFPIDKDTGLPSALYPTRLGNLLASFETYPTVKYGIDGVFFWPRLWVSIDQDLREELDNAQAVVDGSVYACAAFAISSLICTAYFLYELPRLYWQWSIASIGSAILSIVCYYGSLPRYVQYGDLFAAVYDQHRSKLDFTALVRDLDSHVEPSLVRTRTERDTYRAAWRFLRWHRYRGKYAPTNENVKGY